VAQDYAKAREWYEKAADKGEAYAMTNLGRLYSNGHGVAQDYARTREWFEKAADKGDAMEVEWKREGKPVEEMAQALNEVAGVALLARRFPKALTVSDRAQALLPDNLPIETNRAHALMFADHAEESKALYLAHKGQALFERKRWEDVIAEDFAEFRKAGLTHPMMADIEKELGVSP
jgi:TPR repeat protein